MVRHDKHTCTKCMWHGKWKDLLTAKNPFEEGLIYACPQCKEIGSVVWACDFPYCFRPATCGTPTQYGYKNFCGKHYSLEKMDVKEVRK